ncbi:MAG TPA: hypothetical protein VK581_04710 [Chthoniobacterales bacterium]|nr:hypothetical protein [Chthoniobacterales bacterium]
MKIGAVAYGAGDGNRPAVGGNDRFDNRMAETRAAAVDGIAETIENPFQILISF